MKIIVGSVEKLKYAVSSRDVITYSSVVGQSMDSADSTAWTGSLPVMPRRAQLVDSGQESRGITVARLMQVPDDQRPTQHRCAASLALRPLDRFPVYLCIKNIQMIYRCLENNSHLFQF